MKNTRSWMQGAVIYQIYPRSFKDSLGTGVGNLKGIVEKLDYLAGTPNSLGVTAVWLSPIYSSPMADFGYDVSNYTDIDPIFGNLRDLEVLVEEAHKRSMKVLLDFVPNHTSDEHPWFVESKSSTNNDKRDWYVWREPSATGGPPNNWLSVFGGSAWQYDEASQQYYLHSFLAKQPDLNWENESVREAMKSAMRFWLDRGVDGFRVDAVDWMSKDPEMRDDPLNESAFNVVAGFDHGSLKHVYSRDGPHLFDRLNEMTTVLEEYEDRFMIAEAHPETDDKIAGYLRYYQSVNPHLSAPFNFQGIYLPWSARDFGQFITTFQANMRPEYLPIYTVGNHDESRLATRVGKDAARTAAVMLLTLPGMAFIYYGEEIAMQDVTIPDEKIRDPFAGKGNGRDPQRTPMQWDDTVNAGFTTGTPWLPVSGDYPEVNVLSQTIELDSSLSLYRRLLRFRHDSDAIRFGTYTSLDLHEQVLAYERRSENDAIIVILNFSGNEIQLFANELRGRVVLSTHPDGEDTVVTEQMLLRPNEGIVIQLTQ